MTQAERVITYINDFGSISGREAFMDLGVMHLPSVIRDIAKDGYEIEHKRESTKNRYGESVSYVRYSFKEQAS